MFQIFSNYVEENNWLSKLNDFKENRKTKKTQLEKLEKQLAKLNVDTSDYYQNNIDEEYSDIKLSELEKKVTVLDNLENERQKIQNTLKDINNKLLELCGKINSEFQNLINTKLTESEWENKLNELNAKNINIKDEINKISGELNGISVNPSDYIEENPGVEYDAKKYAEIEKEIQQIEDKLKELEKENIELKSEIANLTDTSSTSNWEILTEKLYEKQKEISNSIKQKEAFIIAGYLLHTTIETLRNKEDEQIQNAVNSEYFSNLLFNITGKYNELIINEKQILLASNIGNFYLKDISTGAKEQLLFALRVSLTKDILNDFAFFIFDDAFQHSDYDRRPKLVDQLFNLSDEGWQIIYLTMDDNIRDIFLNKGKNNKNFQEIILGTSTSNDLLSTLF